MRKTIFQELKEEMEKVLEEIKNDEILSKSEVLWVNATVLIVNKKEYFFNPSAQGKEFSAEGRGKFERGEVKLIGDCLLYTSPSPRD